MTTTTEEEQEERQVDAELEKVGALWQNLSKKGNIYFNMDLEGMKYIVLTNNDKEEDKQPDFIIYKRKKGSD